MARKKVTLQRITNDSTRRATFRKRRKGLMKKASELATLCDVDACVVVYGEGETQPEVWPDVEKAAEVLARFKAMPELDQCKKTMDMEGLLTQRIDKQKEQLYKVRRENQERDTTLLLHDAIVGRRPGLAGLSVEDIASLGWMVENRLVVVNNSLERHHAAAAGAGKQQQDNVVVPTTTLQPLQMPQQVSLPLVPPYSIGGPAGGQTDVVHQAPPPNPQPHPQPSWLIELDRAGGDLGALVYSGFGGGRGGSFGGSAGASTSSAGAGTSAGAADMLPHLGNFGTGFGWPDPAGAGPSSFPPM